MLNIAFFEPPHKLEYVTKILNSELQLTDRTVRRNSKVCVSSRKPEIRGSTVIATAKMWALKEWKMAVADIALTSSTGFNNNKKRNQARCRYLDEQHVPRDRKRVQLGTLVHVPGEVGHVMNTILCKK